MPVNAPITDHSDAAAFPADVGGAAAGGPAPPVGSSALLVRMRYAEPQVPVLCVAGELDLATAPQLERLLWPRLQSMLPALVLDLSEVTFLGLAGLELLTAAHTCAGHRDIPLSIVNSAHAVDRALAASGLDATLPCFDTVAAASASVHRVPSTRTTGGHPPQPTPA